MRRSDSTNGPPPSSLVVEGFDPVRERGVEAVLAVGNGYIGTRAALEEHTPASFPLTLVAGTYDPIRPSEEPPPVADAAPTPIAAPDWGALRIWIDKEELRLDHGLCLRHERWLDHDAGTTVRRWHHRLPCGRSVLATFTRLTSLTDRHGALQQVTLLLPDRGAPVRLAAALEVPSVVRQATPYLTRPLLEPPHAALPATIVVRGTQSSIGVAVAQACTLAGDSALEALEGAGHSVDRSRDGLTEWWEWRAEAGITYRWSRMVAVHTSLDAGSAAVAAAVRLRPLSPSAVAEDHRVRWRERWEASAVEVDGDDLVHAALQTANHHLLMAANPADDTVSVAARDLNGEIYRGHVMWDTEIYLLPFYSLSWPEAARAMLRYRHRHLPAAKARARRSGYRGVLYPWESAGGAEGTVALDRDWKGNQTE
ncbi:MAG TPA: hypothetical protein VG455_09485, partial [Acidimicrobiales bacterium]|nr:hypothetical protein [Acidimicrobiales bacterium]